MLTYKSGESAFIESNWLTPYKTRTLTVTGSEGIMRLDYITQELWIEQQTADGAAKTAHSKNH